MNTPSKQDFDTAQAINDWYDGLLGEKSEVDLESLASVIAKSRQPKHSEPGPSSPWPHIDEEFDGRQITPEVEELIRRDPQAAKAFIDSLGLELAEPSGVGGAEPLRQEWIHDGEILIAPNGQRFIIAGATYDANLLMRRINASFAAERERNKQELGILIEANAASILSEREKREQATHRYCLAVEKLAETKMQLLTAQVAIEKIKKADDVSEEVMFIAVASDLSLLHAHDAEVRKPLVEALQQIADYYLSPNRERAIQTTIDCREIANAALAQVESRPQDFKSICPKVDWSDIPLSHMNKINPDQGK